jgi:hypothetical protein
MLQSTKWNKLAENGDQWLAVVNTVMNFGFYKELGIACDI